MAVPKRTKILFVLLAVSFAVLVFRWEEIIRWYKHDYPQWRRENFAPTPKAFVVDEKEEEKFSRLINMNLEDTEIEVEELAKWAADEDVYIRQLVATHIQTSSEILSALAKDGSVFVRRQVAVHPNTPAETLTALAQDEDVYIRQLVVSHPNTAHETLLSLCSDLSTDVLWTLAKKDDIALEILQKLMARYDEIQQKVKETPRPTRKEPQKFEEFTRIQQLLLEYGKVKFQIAANPNASPEILQQLAAEQEWRTRFVIAEHPNTSPQILAELAKDSHPVVKNVALARSSQDAAILAEMTRDPSANIRRAVAKNPATSLELLQTLATDEDPYVQQIARESAQSRQK